MAAMWTSKLGNKYPKDFIEGLDREHHRILKELRKQPANAVCAECGECDTCWASVSLGVFLCVRCSDVHRAVGTHVSKVKGCSGTYLWGPDEIEQMQAIGNAVAEAQYGGACPEARPSKEASKEERVELCRKKYEQRLWAGRPGAAAAAPASQADPQARPSGRAVAVASVAAAPAQQPVAAPARAKAAPAKPADLFDFDDFFGGFDERSSQRPAELAAQGPSSWAWPEQQQQQQQPAPRGVPAAASPDPWSAPRAAPSPSAGGLDDLLGHCLSAAPAPACKPEALRANPWPQAAAAGGAAVVWDNFGAW